MDVVDALNNYVGTANMTFSSHSFEVRIPLALIGGDDGFVYSAVVVGGMTSPNDCVPNSGYLNLLPTRLHLPLVEQ